jgi:hypothetical protein
LAERGQLTVDADTQTNYSRATSLSAAWLTLMLYELSNAGRECLDMAYQDLSGPNLAKISIALRTPDYGWLLPSMLKSLDQAFRTNPLYGGWARHSYNDALPER